MKKIKKKKEKKKENELLISKPVKKMTTSAFTGL